MCLELDHLFVKSVTIWDVFLSEDSLSVSLFNMVADFEIENGIGMGSLGKAPCELWGEPCNGLF